MSSERKQEGAGNTAPAKWHEETLALPEKVVSELNILEQTDTVPTHKRLKPEIFQAIAKVHPGPKGFLGHGGVERTLQLLRTQHKSWKVGTEPSRYAP